MAGFEHFATKQNAAPGPGRLNGWMVGRHLIWLIVLPCWALRQARVPKSKVNFHEYSCETKKVRFSPVERLKRSQGMQPGKIRWLI